MELTINKIDDFIQKINFQKNAGLIPAIIQDTNSNQVLMLGYMNDLALRKSLETKQLHFWSRTRNQLWLKGEMSGNSVTILDCVLDCDNDSLLFLVIPSGPICHTGETSCFKNMKTENVTTNSRIIEQLYNIILKRIANPKKNSYVATMIEKGLESILKKIGEEATELVIAGQKNNRSEIIHEAADLLFHSMLLLAIKGINLEDIYFELNKRHQAKLKNPTIKEK